MKDKMYKERMLVEFEELVTKLAKITKRVEESENETDELLVNQINAMQEYKRILAVRILKEMGRYED